MNHEPLTIQSRLIDELYVYILYVFAFIKQIELSMLLKFAFAQFQNSDFQNMWTAHVPPLSQFQFPFFEQ